MTDKLVSDVEEIAGLVHRHFTTRGPDPLEIGQPKDPAFNRWFDRGLHHLQRGESQLGIDAFTKAIEVDGENPFAYDNRARLYGEMGEYEQAVADLLQVLRRAPHDLDAFVRLGESLLDGGQPSLAKMVYEKAFALLEKVFPAHRELVEERIYLGLARAHFGAGDLDTAKRCVQAALSIDSASVSGLELEGRIHLAAGQAALAAASLNRALELEPEDPELYALRARAHRADGDEAAARSDFEDACERAAGVAEVLYNLGVDMTEAGHADWALFAMDAAIERKPEFAQAWYMRGYLLSDEHPDQALVAMRRALDLDPQDADAWAGYGRILRDLGRTDEAVTAFERSLELSPGDIDTKVSLGIALVQRKAYREALTYFQMALKADERCVAAYLGRIMLFDELEDYKSVLADAEKILDIVPGHVQARIFQGSAQIFMGHLETGLDSLEATLEDSEGYDRALCLAVLASGKIRQGRLEEASAHLIEAFDICPQEEELRYVKSQLLLEQGALSAASAEIRAAILANPSDPRFHELEGDILKRGGGVAAACEAYARGLAASAGRITQDRLRAKMAVC